MSDQRMLEISATKDRLRQHEEHVAELRFQIKQLHDAANRDPTFDVKSKLEELIRWSKERLR